MPTRRADSIEATRAALIQAARELFADRGYAAVGTEEIVRRAAVTRGALYHHFRDKRDLFRAVFTEINREVVAEVLATAGQAEDAWDRVRIGWQSFLDVCVTRRAVQQIVFVDAPAVLGWTELRQLDTQYSLGAVRTVIEDAMDAGYLERRPVEPLAHILLGALHEAGLMIANAADVDAMRASVADTLDYLFESLRIRH